MVLDLKNIQAKHVIANVTTILNTIFIDSKSNFSLNSSTFLRFRFNNKSGKKYNALINPQAMNVQLAPCQNPLTKKIMNVLRTLNQVLPLLPPSGMYK